MSSTSSLLCASCGLCCNGSFFAQITLRAEEPSRLQRRGLPIVQRDDQQLLELPCPMHTGSSCAVYDDRPYACANYRCRLLRNLEEARVSFDDAVTKVERLWSLRRAIWSALPHIDTHESVFKAAERFFETDTGVEWRRQHAQLMLDMAAFLTMSRSDFGVSVE